MLSYWHNKFFTIFHTILSFDHEVKLTNAHVSLQMEIYCLHKYKPDKS